jgi:cell division protein FtsL
VSNGQLPPGTPWQYAWILHLIGQLATLATALTVLWATLHNKQQISDVKDQIEQHGVLQEEIKDKVDVTNQKADAAATAAKAVKTKLESKETEK